MSGAAPSEVPQRGATSEPHRRTRRADARSGWAAAVRAQWPLALILTVGASIRAVVLVSYRPALFFSDSWGYLATAFSPHPGALPAARPVGYPVLVRLGTSPGRDLTQLVLWQHMAGLACGCLVYAVLVRAGSRRRLAAGAAALVLLDGYAVTLEQYVMPDAFFTLTLLGALLLVTWPRLGRSAGSSARCGWRRAAAAGLLVAAAAIEREAGVFAIPAVLGYLALVRAGWRSLLAVTVTVSLPLVAYASALSSETGVFGLSATTGWTQYSRVAGFADCSGVTVARPARPLCETRWERARHPSAPSWYMWDAMSPAVRTFRRASESTAQRARANQVLGRFAREMILHEPTAFAGAIAADFVRYFTPGARPYRDGVSATVLPRSARDEDVNQRVRRTVVPGVRLEVSGLTSVARAYRSVLHLPRPVLAALALLGCVAIVLRVPRWREAGLFVGTALALILGTAATVGFGERYLLPAVPLLAIGGALAWAALSRAWRATA